MAKKDFKTNPAMNFISPESIEAVDGKTEKATTPKGNKPDVAKAGKPAERKRSKKTASAPAGYKPNPEYIETKSKRVQLLVQPSIYEAVKAKAKAEGISANEAINEALREYVER